MSNQFPFGIVDPDSTNLDTADPRDVTCYIQYTPNDYDGDIGPRISAIFVILFVSSAVTFFPVLATRVKSLHIPLYVYLFARYFGTGVIIATGFIHLLDPSYYEVGGNTCVGMTGGWATYSWPPALALGSLMFTFLLDLIAERYVEKKYGISQHQNVNPVEAHFHSGNVDAGLLHYEFSRSRTRLSRSGTQPDAGLKLPARQSMQQDDETLDNDTRRNTTATEPQLGHAEPKKSLESIGSDDDAVAETAFRQQISAFLILEFGVLFHSVIIGLTLGAAGSNFGTLYAVIVFHQSFEGLGLGARLSAIPFPKRLNWLPWALCSGYGLTTPIAIAIGLGVRTSYDPNSYTASVVSGILDGISGGILIYTGLVELLARDFMFNPDRTNDDKQLAFMVGSMLLGAGLMALLGKWA